MLLASLRLGLLVTSVCLAMTGAKAVAAAGGAPTAPVVGWIDIKSAAQAADQIVITGHAFALSDSAGEFKLEIKRASKNGHSNTAQAGKFKLTAGQTGALSTTAINVQPAESLEINLTLTVDGKSVAVVTVRAGPQDGGKEI